MNKKINKRIVYLTSLFKGIKICFFRDTFEINKYIKKHKIIPCKGPAFPELANPSKNIKKIENLEIKDLLLRYSNMPRKELTVTNVKESCAGCHKFSL